jgi:methionine synthase I (cobalamin-dependent)
MLLSLATQGISTEGINCATGNQPNDPSQCRMVSSSDLIYSMIPNHFISGSGVEVIMKYDLTEDPASDNTINKWNAGYDLYLKTAYDYTRWGGPLGM